MLPKRIKGIINANTTHSQREKIIKALKGGKFRDDFLLFKYLLMHGLKPIPYHPEIYISHKYKFICFQTLKVASSTQYKLMYDLHKHPGNPKETRGLTIVRQIEYAYCPSKYQYDDYYKWAFVRSPWSRLFSFYMEKIHDRTWEFVDIPFPAESIKVLRRKYHNIHQFNSMTFEDFVKRVGKIPDFLCDTHILPQCYFFNPQEMDFIGRFENFEADMLKILRVVAPDYGIKKLEKLNQSNSKGGKSYRDHYTDETREIVARKYARDIELFDYQF